jgi:hypothetical protein
VQTGTHWSAETGEKLGESVVAIGRALWRDDTARRQHMLDNVSRYEGIRLRHTDPSAYRDGSDLQTDAENPIEWNLCRSLVSTATSDIAAGQQPKVQFVASNADWQTRRKGPKLDAFITGLWSARQEPYADIWELGVQAFRDAAICGIGAIKIESDIQAGRVVHTRVLPWGLLVDPGDGRAGAPKNLTHVYTESRQQLLAWYPEAAGALALAKVGYSTDDEFDGLSAIATYTGVETVVESIRCYEWWSLPLGPESKGKHVLAFDGGILLEEEWTRDSFPFALIRWDRSFQGWHGHSLIDDISLINDEMNNLLARIARTVRLTSLNIVWSRDGETVNVNNEDAANYTYTGPTPPQTECPQPVNPTHLQLLNSYKSSAYELSGVNQQTATAQKQPGIEAASAIRLVSDLQSKRFAVALKAYQSLFVEVARHDISCVRELAEDDKDFSVKWPGNGFLKSINWRAVDLADDMFSIQIASAPSIKGTAADRMQTAQELYGSGQISSDSFLAIRTYLDLPGELDRTSRQRNVVESYVDAWLDATPEEIESNVNSEGKPLFRPPIRWMRLEDALLQVADAYLQAEIDGVPDDNRDLFLRWIEMADSEIQKKQARLAALQQPPPAPPGAPPPPPPGGPSA